jgi:vacuolar-type H+-ATPase subunit H
MRDIVQEIVEAEERAEQLLHRAREEAARITADADIEAKGKVAEARAEAQELAGHAAQNARLEARKTRKRSVEEAEQRIRNLSTSGEKSLDDLADHVAGMIIETDLD